jgi:histidyl-tRNA synthetase
MLEAWWYLDNAPKKAIWTTAVTRKIHEHWSKPIVESTPYYNGLRYLSCVNLEKGKLHPILKINCSSKGDLHRLPTKLKLLTGSYILQSNRIKMFKNESNILCLLCSKDNENIKHFILDCERLEEVRKPILQEIEEILNDKETSWKCLSQDTKIQLLLDITSVISKLNLDPASVANVAYYSRRLMFHLHMLRQTRILDMQGTIKQQGSR